MDEDPRGCSEHDPIRVVNDLVMDQAGRPERWLWHVECYRCGEVLDVEVQLAAGAAGV